MSLQEIPVIMSSKSKSDQISPMLEKDNIKLVAENEKLIEEIKNLNEAVLVLSDSNETYQKFFINMKKSFDDFARKELLLPH